MPAAPKERILIIGAGLTGLVTAATLAGAGYPVTVLESASQPGGMVESFNLASASLEYIYHHIFTHDHWIISLIEKAGLDRQLSWVPTRDALYAQHRLHPFTSPLDLLRFPLIPLHQRFLTGLAVLRAGRLGDWTRLEDITARQWLVKNGGQAAYSQIWEPLLRSKFDADAEIISAVWIWNKFKQRGSSRNRSGSSGRLGYLSGSFGQLTDLLSARIRDNGGRILTGHTVMDISHEEKSAPCYRIASILEDCSTVYSKAERIIATISTRQFAGITANLHLPADYRRKITNVAYKSNLCLVLRLKKPLSDYYWTTICDEMPFVVIVEHTNIEQAAKYGGHIVYLSRYLDVSDPLWMQPDNIIFRQFVLALRTVYPNFSPAQIVDWRLRRTRYAQPVIRRNYTGLMPQLKTPLPGLLLAGTAQIYPEDRGMNYAVRLGLQAAGAVLNESADRPLAAQDPLVDWLITAARKADQL